MSVTTSFKYSSIFIILFNVLFVMFTLGYMGLFLSYFQFWRIESRIFKNDLFKLLMCIKIQIFTNLICTLFNNYALNIASKFMLKFTRFILSIGVFTTATFIVILYQVYCKTYANAVQTNHRQDMQLHGFIASRYTETKTGTMREKVAMCIEEMDYLVKHTKIFLIVSLCALIITYFFTKLMTWIKITKKDTIPPHMRSSLAAMDTNSIKNVKVINK